MPPLHSMAVHSLPKPPLWLRALSWPMTVLTDEVFGHMVFLANSTGLCLDRGLCSLFNHKQHSDATAAATLVLNAAVVALLVLAFVGRRRGPEYTSLALACAALLIVAPFATTFVWSYAPPVEPWLMPQDQQIYVRTETLIPPSRPALDTYYNTSHIRHFNALWTKNTGSDNPSWLSVERGRRTARPHCEAYFRQWDTMLPPRRGRGSAHQQAAARQLAEEPSATHFTDHNPDVIPRKCINDGIVAATSPDMFASVYQPYRCAVPRGARRSSRISPSALRARPCLSRPRPASFHAALTSYRARSSVHRARSQHLPPNLACTCKSTGEAKYFTAGGRSFLYTYGTECDSAAISHRLVPHEVDNPDRTRRGLT